MRNSVGCCCLRTRLVPAGEAGSMSDMSRLVFSGAVAASDCATGGAGRAARRCRCRLSLTDDDDMDGDERHHDHAGAMTRVANRVATRAIKHNGVDGKARSRCPLKKRSSAACDRSMGGVSCRQCRRPIGLAKVQRTGMIRSDSRCGCAFPANKRRTR